MKLPAKSAKKVVEIQDFYAIKVGALWQGLKQEHISFWLFFLFIIFLYVRPQSLYTVIDILPWSGIIFYLSCVVAFFDKTATWVKSHANGLLIAFFILVLLSSVFAFNPSLSWEKFRTFVNWVILYFLFITVVNSEKIFFLFVLLYLLVNFKMSQHGFHSFASRGFAYAQWGVIGSPGWFHNAADFGIQMTIFVPFAIAFILAMKAYWGRYKKWLFYLLPITGAVTIIATASRGAQLAAVAVILWFFMKSKHTIRALAVLLVLGFATYTVLPDEMLAEYQEMGDDGTSQSRLAFWTFGMEVIKDKPVLGVGYENWMAYCWFANPFGLGEEGFDCMVMHNTYLQAAAELGVPGFLLFTSIMLFMFVQNAKTRKNARQSGNQFIVYMSHGLDGGVVGFAVASFFISVLFYPMLWMQLAMTVALHQISKKKIRTLGSTV